MPASAMEHNPLAEKFLNEEEKIWVRWAGICPTSPSPQWKKRENNMTPIEMIKKELESSALSAVEQAEFLRFISGLSGQHIMDVLGMAKEDPNFLSFLWTNYDRKKKAFRLHDETMVEDILREEKTLLAEMENEG